MDYHLFRWVHPLSRIMQSQLGAMYSPTSSLSRLGAESLQFFVLYDHVDHHQTLTHLAGVFQQMANHSKMQREKDEAWYEDDPKALLTLYRNVLALRNVPAAHQGASDEVERQIISYIRNSYAPQRITADGQGVLWSTVAQCRLPSSVDTLLTQYELPEAVAHYSGGEGAQLVEHVLGPGQWPWVTLDNASSGRDGDIEKQRYILTKYVGEDALVKNIHAGLEEAKKDLSATKITYEKLVYAAITLTHLTGKCHDFSLDIPNCSTMHLSSLQKYCLFVYGLHEKGMEGLLPKNAVPLLETALVQNLEQLYSERETWTTVNYFINLNKLPEDRLRQVLQPYHLRAVEGLFASPMSDPKVLLTVLYSSATLNSPPDVLRSVVGKVDIPSLSLQYCCYAAMAVDQMLQAGVPSEVYDPLAKQLSVKLNRELLEREGSARVVYLLLEKCPSFLQTYTPEVQPILWGMVAKEAENGFRARQLTTLLAHNCLSSEDARRVKAVAEKLPIR